MITGNGYNLSIAGFANSLDGFNEADDRAVKRRSQIRKDALELANMAAEQGIQLGVDDWAQQVSGLLSPGDFLTSTAPTSDVANLMRQTQNAKAEKADTDRKRAEFRAELEDNEKVEQEIARRSLSGDSPEQIALGLRDAFGERADSFVPRIQAISNATVMKERIDAQTKFADMFESEEDAGEFIKTNKGLTKAAQEGIMEAGKRARVKREDMIHQTAMSVADKVGSTVGAVDRRQVETLVNLALPPSAKPEVRRQALDKAWDMAVASQQAAQAGAGFKTSQAIAQHQGQNAVQTAALLANAERLDRADAETRVKQETDRLYATTQTPRQQLEKTLADMSKPKSGASKEDIAAHKLAIGITSTHFIQDTGALVDALKRGDMAEVEILKAAAPTMQDYNARVSAVTSFLKGPRFSSLAEVQSSVDSALPSVREAEGVGRQYMNYIDAASSSSSDPSASPELKASKLRANFIEDSADAVNGANALMVQSGRVSMSGQDVVAMNRRIAERYVRSFLKGASLDEVGPEGVSKLVNEIISRVQAPAEITPRIGAADDLRNALTAVSRDNGLAPTSFAQPGAAMPSPRIGVPQPNQRWDSWWR